MIFQILRNWYWLQNSQWMSKKQLTKIQTIKLKEIVKHAYEKVPFYRTLYSEAGVNPQNITDIESIAKLPSITKENLRKIPLAQRTAVDINIRSCAPRTTSGTTGAPITILRDSPAVSYRIALWLRYLSVHGIVPWHRALINVTSRDSTNLFANRKGFASLLLRQKIRPLWLDADIHENLKLISIWKPDAIVAPPSYFKALIASAEQIGQSLKLRVALTVGEMLDGQIRKLIRESFYADVFDAYGVGETGWIAWECPTHSGYHMNIDSVAIEFLRDGIITADDSGELCITNLYNKATPIIRYRVGDLATLKNEECPCGRGLPLMRNIQGRIIDFILTSDGRYISPYVIMHSLETMPGIAQFKVTQMKDYSIQILLKTSTIKDESVILNAEKCCKQLFGETPVSVEIIDHFEKPISGKFKVVESQLNK